MYVLGMYVLGEYETLKKLIFDHKIGNQGSFYGHLKQLSNVFIFHIHSVSYNRKINCKVYNVLVFCYIFFCVYLLLGKV